MNKRKNSQYSFNNNGITLVALVITIIIMLILAAVSINAAIGENGIITHAMKAQEETKLAQEKEELEFLITDFNTSMGLSTVDEFLNTKADPDNPDRKLEEYYMIPDPEDPEDEEKMMRVCKLNGRFYRIIQDGEYFKVELINSDASNIGSGITIATKETFTGGTMNFDPGTGNNSMLVFNDKIDEEYNFNIVSGNATIYINDSMTLTNANVRDIDGNGRSAINIYPDATLNLVIRDGATLIVDSGYGIDAATDTSKTIGKGGYAGIHVPVGATINIRGKGSVKAYGGKASQGGSWNGTYSQGGGSTGGSGGGGAGAGIGGHGGNGGAGVGSNSQPGEAGENCGTVNILGTVSVYAYGGMGGAGGPSKARGNGGGGGYPAAGIGGGGAGGAGGTGCCAGGGGYTGGTTFQGNPVDSYTNNGMAGLPAPEGKRWYNVGWNGGGYFEGPSPTYNSQILKDKSGTIIENIPMISILGGIGSQGAAASHKTGHGGVGGAGGTVNVSNTAKVYAFNGNRYTDGTSYENGLNQCPIYLQRGIKVTNYNYIAHGYVRSTEYDTVPKLQLQIENEGVNDNSLKTTYANAYYDGKSVSERSITMTIGGEEVTIDMLNQGVGSGAGYQETSNGTYNIISGS